MGSYKVVGKKKVISIWYIYIMYIIHATFSIDSLTKLSIKFYKMIISESASGSSQLQVKGFTHVMIMICPMFLPAKNVKQTSHATGLPPASAPSQGTEPSTTLCSSGMASSGATSSVSWWRFGHRHGKGSYASLQFFQVRLPVQYVGGFLNTKVSHTNWSLKGKASETNMCCWWSFPWSTKTF